jgi:hypothetical protein
MNSELMENEKKGGDSALVALDMAEIFSLVQTEEARELPPSDGRTVSSATGVPSLGNPLSTPRLATELLTPEERRLPACVPILSPLHSPRLAVSLRQLDHETYRVLMAPSHGIANAVNLDVPVGLPRIINVATLKAMLGANSRDVVFHKGVDEERWAICPNDFPVDLSDRTHIFKVREWAIIS